MEERRVHVVVHPDYHSVRFGLTSSEVFAYENALGEAVCTGNDRDESIVHIADPDAKPGNFDLITGLLEIPSLRVPSMSGSGYLQNNLDAQAILDIIDNVGQIRVHGSYMNHCVRTFIKNLASALFFSNPDILVHGPFYADRLPDERIKAGILLKDSGRLGTPLYECVQDDETRVFKTHERSQAIVGTA